MDAVAAQHPVRARFVLRDGAEAGILAAAAVLIVHFGFDLAAAEPFRTPAILHSLFQGELRGEATASFGGADAARYSSALLLLWFIVGLAVSFLIAISDAYPDLLGGCVGILEGKPLLGQGMHENAAHKGPMNTPIIDTNATVAGGLFIDIDRRDIRLLSASPGFETRK